MSERQGSMGANGSKPWNNKFIIVREMVCGVFYGSVPFSID
jgi:hypothetical protein